VLHNKLHSETTIEQNNVSGNISTIYSPANNTITQSPFLRLTE